MRLRRLIDLVAVAAFALPVVAIAQESATDVQGSVPEAKQETKPEAKQETKSGEIKQKTKKEAEAELEKKQLEIKELKERAGEITKAMGDLAASGKIPTSQEAVAAMRAMVDVLQEIQERLSKIEQDIEGIKGWIEGQNEALPIMSNDINDLKRSRWGNYIQVQYRDTDQVGGATDAFGIRRMRLGLTQSVDPRTVLRVSFDVATGTTQNVAQLRDAFVRWDLEPSFEKIGTELSFGQFPLALGYELERSSGEREFPERTLYNRTMFAGERSRGLMVKHGIGPNMHVHLGGFNALTFDDPEQRSIAPGPANRLAVAGGVRWYNERMDLGLSMFRGERPSVTTTRTVSGVTTTYVHPKIDREFLFLDGTFVGFIVPEAFIRFEYMKGKDRVPITPGANNSVSSIRGQVDMQGYQVHLGYNINSRNQINVRYDEFDPDEDVANNVVQTKGLAYSYFINPGARITLSREWIKDPSRAGIDDVNYQITTLRVIFRF